MSYKLNNHAYANTRKVRENYHPRYDYKDGVNKLLDLGGAIGEICYNVKEGGPGSGTYTVCNRVLIAPRIMNNSKSYMSHDNTIVKKIGNAPVFQEIYPSNQVSGTEDDR